MASLLFQNAILITAVCSTLSQNPFWPYEISDGSSYRQTFLPQSYASPPMFSTFRRAECSHQPGSSCMFVLLCLMGGGVSAGSCSGSLLSTCCVMPSAAPAIAPARRLPALAPAFQTVEAKPVDQSLVKNATLKNTTDPANFTQCGIAQMRLQKRIIGGTDATYGEFPWQAHIKLNRQQCGGVLLNNYYVLTAAHCIYQVRLRDITIQLGVYDIQDHSRQEFPPQTFTVVEKKVHPKFKYQAAHPDRYDVALLKLDRAAVYQENVVPICLPRKNWDFLGWKGIITGWGKTDTGLSNRYGTRLLQKVDVPIISNDQCEEWHQDKGIDISISPEMMCAGYEEGKKDACVGDSGGPLMVSVRGRWTVVGLVSAGFGCAQTRQPGIYHRVPHTVDWLRKNINS
ncbi:trypsin-1-like [Uloborus diversus]|uniref:trypsin-1-like n=1 Tax=Uloborus diversus TaxID=327109 RepID=UPI00240A54DE|nr:trypsin-1-like [Uloborus diversus]